jgi:hypothetical protein
VLEVVCDEPHDFALRRAGQASALVHVGRRDWTSVVKIPGLAAGDWEIVSEGKRGDDVVATARIDAGRTTVVDLSNRKQFEASIRLVAAGHPVVGADVASWDRHVRARSDELGVAVLRSAWPVERWRLWITPSDLDAATMRYEWPGGASEPKEPRDVELGSARLAVSVRSADGAVVRDASVALMRASDPMIDAKHSTDAAGVARWSSLPGGTYVTVASVPGLGHGWETVRIDSDDTAVTVRLRNLGRLRIHAKDAAGRPRADLRLVVAGDEYQLLRGITRNEPWPYGGFDEVTTDLAGDATLSVPEGRVVVVEIEDYASHFATIVAGETTELLIEK